jgi:hypothetical protein
MHERKVHLDGRELAIREGRVGLGEVLFEPTNPRIQFQLDTSLSDDAPTQGQLGFALVVSNDSYVQLRESIEINGGVVNPIWIAPAADGYVVIEGNTRLQVYLDLREKYPNDEKWKSIPVFLLPEQCSRNQINFIRLEAHLFGTTPWDAYEKARELHRLNQEEDYSVERLARMTKLTTSDIRSSIQAFRDMDEHYLSRYGDPGEHQKFSYFVEFRKNSDLKRLVKEGQLNIVDFCTWVGEGKFGRGEDVRRLGAVLRDPQARQALLEHDFPTALEQLAQVNPAATSPLFDKIQDVTAGIRRMSFSEIQGIRRGQDPAKVALLEDLSETVNAFLDSLRDGRAN